MEWAEGGEEVQQQNLEGRVKIVFRGGHFIPTLLRVSWLCETIEREAIRDGGSPDPGNLLVPCALADASFGRRLRRSNARRVRACIPYYRAVNEKLVEMVTIAGSPILTQRTFHPLSRYRLKCSRMLFGSILHETLQRTRLLRCLHLPAEDRHGDLESACDRSALTKALLDGGKVVFRHSGATPPRGRGNPTIRNQCTRCLL